MRVPAATSLALWLGLAGRVSADQVIVSAYGPFAVESRGHGEMSAPAYDVRAWTNGLLEARYAAPAGHCSSLRIHFEVDGRERAVSRIIPPGGDTGLTNLGEVSRGEHAITFRAEGVKGGCNLGRLLSWGGRAWVRTTMDGSTAASDAPLDGVFFGSEYENWAWGHVVSGCILTADGAINVYGYGRGEPIPELRASDDGLYADEDLRARFAHGLKLAGRLPADQLRRLDSLEPLLLQAADGGVIGNRVAADAGLRSLTAYLPVGPRHAYRPVVLSTSGDVEGRNDSPAAAEVLKALGALPKVEGCPGL